MNWSTTDGSQSRHCGPSICHEPAAVGVRGEVGVGEPEDVVGAAAGDVGAQRVEVGRVGDEVDAHFDVGMRAGELVERLPICRGDLLVPQPHGDDDLAAATVRPDLPKQHRRRRQQRRDDG